MQSVIFISLFCDCDTHVEILKTYKYFSKAHLLSSKLLLTTVISILMGSANAEGPFHPVLCLVSGMSEVSLEAVSGKASADDPHKDCEEPDKAEEGSLSEDVTPETERSSREGEDKADMLYEININSDEENAESCSKAVQEKDGGTVVSSSVGSGAKHQGEAAEAPKENGESLSETKVIFTFIFDNQPYLAPPLCAPACRILFLDLL